MEGSLRGVMTIILLLGKVFLQDSLKGYFQGVAEGFEKKWERTKSTGNDSEKYSQDRITGILLNIDSDRKSVV